MPSRGRQATETSPEFWLLSRNKLISARLSRIRDAEIVPEDSFRPVENSEGLHQRVAQTIITIMRNKREAVAQFSAFLIETQFSQGRVFNLTQSLSRKCAVGQSRCGGRAPVNYISPTSDFRDSIKMIDSASEGVSLLAVPEKSLSVR
jgi:hypothetical protein